MRPVKGRFRQGGQIVAEDVPVYLKVVGREPHVLWYGSYQVPKGAPLVEPGQYEIEFEDGRRGNVTISDGITRGAFRYGGFTGNGPLLGSGT